MYSRAVAPPSHFLKRWNIDSTAISSVKRAAGGRAAALKIALGGV